MLENIKKVLFEVGNVVRFELDDWYKWYKEPEKFHNAVVSYLENDGKKVETIQINKNVTSNKISTMFIDGIKYELSIESDEIAQTVALKKIE